MTTYRYRSIIFDDTNAELIADVVDENVRFKTYKKNDQYIEVCFYNTSIFPNWFPQWKLLRINLVNNLTVI